MSPGKSLPITKRMVWEAYQRVKRNGKAAGVDGQSLEAFAGDLGNNFYGCGTGWLREAIFLRQCAAWRSRRPLARVHGHWVFPRSRIALHRWW
jgi:hypothetical protein